MHCHICGKAAIGQCQACWKFYCKEHGDITCEECPSTSAPDARPGRLVAGHATGWDAIREQQADPNLKEALDAIKWLQSRREVLLRVIPAVKSQTHGGTQITVISIEAYDDGFVLNYRLKELTPRDEPDVTRTMFGAGLPQVHWEARDNRGGVYMGGTSGAGGSPEEWRGEASFAPALFKEAETLTVSCEEVQWMAFGPGQRSRIQSGPWTFDIALT